MTFQLLIASVNGEPKNLLNTMRVSSPAVLVNQCEVDSRENFTIKDMKVLCINQAQRGVGLSRNTALENADAEIILFSDEDIVYYDDYMYKVLKAFENHPQASVITFNIDVDSRRRTYYNQDVHEIKWNNYGRYPAYAIAARRKDLMDHNLRFSLLFGGGAKYSNGEDSLFLHDCLKAGLKMTAETALLGAETYRESTWFKGYTDKFFFDRGVLYYFLYGNWASYILGARFIFKNRKEMLKNIGFFKAYSLLRKGITEGKSL